MIEQKVPEFAVVGHPNEGKSSVLSTLAEDDSVRISPIPGETRECRRFPVTIDGREVIAFVDTPGFQNPRRTLQWMQHYQGPDERLLVDFIAAHGDDAAFHDDCRLLKPLIDGAGIIFVVDGSRPVRNMDKAEMEILRLTGRPRMAILNCKEDDSGFLGQWQQEFRKHFNSIRVFNSIRATYAERIALLESLKGIDQTIEGVLELVIRAFKEDWSARTRQSAGLITALLEEVLSYRKTVALKEGEDEEELQEKMRAAFTRFVGKKENSTHRRIRKLFKHNIFTPELPPQSILRQDLFSEKTWQFLGLNQRQLIMTGGLGGAALGAGLDLAAAGITFGVFSAIGGVLGAAGTALKGRELLSGVRLLGMKLDQQQLKFGPVNNIQLMYILLDRVLLFYSLVINWAHGRRDYAEAVDEKQAQPGKQGYTRGWSRSEQKICERFFQAITGDVVEDIADRSEALHQLLVEKLTALSGG
ncbi:MAG: GTPase/DUF3482 domain-containing protein [Desulfobulbaceae bacterium]|nr:GTPase/DUF3482 domain-containing protein [Desulfobulbaceae bacterium]